MLSIWKFFGRGGNGRNAIKSNSKKAPPCRRRKIDRRVLLLLVALSRPIPTSPLSPLSRNKREPANLQPAKLQPTSSPREGQKWHALVNQSGEGWTSSIDRFRSSRFRCERNWKKELWDEGEIRGLVTDRISAKTVKAFTRSYAWYTRLFFLIVERK